MVMKSIDQELGVGRKQRCVLKAPLDETNSLFRKTICMARSFAVRSPRRVFKVTLPAEFNGITSTNSPSSQGNELMVFVLVTTLQGLSVMIM